MDLKVGSGMKGLLCILAAVPLLVGCSTPRRAQPTQERRQDSTHTEVVTKTCFVTDTVLLEIPAQAAERTTADSVSRLENDYATSEAHINPDGTLYHDLKTKPQEIQKEVETPVRQRDSTVYRYGWRDVVRTVEVERELAWIEQGQIYGFRLLAALVVVWLIWRNKSKVITIIRKLI